MQTHVLFTQKGYDDKKKEYEDLLASRPDAVKDLAKAREMGDLSENGYYKGARLKLSQVDRQLRQLKQLLKIAKVHEAKEKDIVDMGTTVMLESNGKILTYEIVGTYEAHPGQGKISLNSPLGRAVAGKRKGETAVMKIGDTTTTFVIVNII